MRVHSSSFKHLCETRSGWNSFADALFTQGLMAGLDAADHLLCEGAGLHATQAHPSQPHR